jgi:hypothetical protein
VGGTIVKTENFNKEQSVALEISFGSDAEPGNFTHPRLKEFRFLERF